MAAQGRFAQPFINFIHEKMLDQNIIHADKTRVQVLNELGRSAEVRALCGYCAVRRQLVLRCCFIMNRPAN